MTNQEIIDLAASFDLITFGPQDLVMFAREIEALTAAAEREECAKVAEWILKMPENDISTAIRARGEKNE